MKNKFEKQASGYSSINFDPTPGNRSFRSFGVFGRDGVDDFSFTKKSEDVLFNNNNNITFEDYINNPQGGRPDFMNSYRGASPMTRRQTAKIMEQQRVEKLMSPNQTHIDLNKCSHCPL